MQFALKTCTRHMGKPADGKRPPLDQSCALWFAAGSTPPRFLCREAKLLLPLGASTGAFPTVNRRVMYFFYLHLCLKSGNKEYASEPQRETYLCVYFLRTPCVSVGQ